MTKIKLGELLIQHNLLTATQLQQALKAQKIYGGRLGTNLIELGFINETQLTEFLAKQLNISAAKPTDFETIDSEVLALIPKDFAANHRVIPLKLENHKLKVAFGDPLDLKAREETTFRVGHAIIPMVAPEILITYALEKFYKVEVGQRYLKLNEPGKQGGQGFEDLLIRVPIEEMQSEEELVSRDIIKDVGTYTTQTLSKDLFDATTREEVFFSLFRFLEPYCTKIATFITRHQEVWGWMQQGYAIDNQHFRQKLVELNTNSTIATVFLKKDIQLNPKLTPLDHKLIEKLGGDPKKPAQLYPILLGGRVISTVLLTLHDNVQAHELAGKLEETQEVLTKVSIALEVVGLRRKLLLNTGQQPAPSEQKSAK